MCEGFAASTSSCVSAVSTGCSSDSSRHDPMLASLSRSRLLPKLSVADESFDQPISNIACLSLGTCVTPHDFAALYFSQMVSLSTASRLKGLFCVTGLDETSLSAASIVKVGSIVCCISELFRPLHCCIICFSVARKFVSHPTVYDISIKSRSLQCYISHLSAATASVSLPTLRGMST